MPPVELTVSAILFDSDGTLVDSTPAVRATISRWCAAQGVNPREFAAAQHGTRAKDLLRRFAANELDEAVEELEREVGRTASEMAREGKGGIVMLPGHRDLRWVARSSIDYVASRQASLTSSHAATRTHACAALDAAGIDSTPPNVPVLVTGELVAHGKPHSEPYLAGLARAAGLEAKDVLVVEDAPAGLQSGASAGCRILAVCTGPVPANEVAQAVAEIPGAVVVRDLARGAHFRIQHSELGRPRLTRRRPHRSVELLLCSPHSITLRIHPL
ncbi:HAD-superfamily hydrolase, subfamily IA, variant 3 [Rhodotorula diobovata]|uniref:HAD-superfamily hydrolase, subfamily IA, variant 3 n=1 Tax=Rhodotorula diobovata TaxID=5288 RepID=A0A5C5FSD8_9BASI|nr:HAD-superfamily hydrolase, subfamily IA, variant 3 [Rhodotorula diobovata]